MSGARSPEIAKVRLSQPTKSRSNKRSLNFWWSVIRLLGYRRAGRPPVPAQTGASGMKGPMWVMVKDRPNHFQVKRTISEHCVNVKKIILFLDAIYWVQGVLDTRG